MKTYNVKIEDIAFRGKGVSRINGKTVFVRNALLGEELTVNITKEHKNYLEADIVEIIKSSPERIQPACPYTNNKESFCPGCCYQNCSYTEEIKYKENQLLTLIKRFANIEVKLQETVPSKKFLGYRNKITLHKYENSDEIFLGYYGPDNRRVLDIENCILAMKPIASTINVIRNDAKRYNAINSMIIIRASKIDTVKTWTKGQRKKETIQEETPYGNVTVPVTGFYQINPYVSVLLIKYIETLLKEIKPDIFIDLYCGIGNFSFAAANAGLKDIYGIEVDRKAIKYAVKNSKELGFDFIKFRAFSAKEGINKIAKHRVLSDNTVILVDPPRQGLDKDTLKHICNTNSNFIIYISCSPDTLARDLNLMKKYNYNIISTKIFDMFPRTAYFETVVVLKKQL